MLFGGCGTSPESRPPSFTIKPKIEQNSNPHVPLAGVLFFDTDESVITKIQIQDGKNKWQLEYDETQDPGQGLPVIGLRPDLEHTINVTIQDAEGNQTSIAQPLSFTRASVKHRRSTAAGRIPIRGQVNFGGFLRRQPLVISASLSRELGR